jgi:uncharacterized protein YdbL (DUF1318 family)
MRRGARAAATLALGIGLVLAAAPAARALDLDTAKRQGLVGEQVDGFVGAVAPDPAADVRALVADVNARRRSSYEDIARKTGSPVEAVAALAAQKLIDRAPAGAWIGDGGRWYRKQ